MKAIYRTSILRKTWNAWGGAEAVGAANSQIWIIVLIYRNTQVKIISLQVSKKKYIYIYIFLWEKYELKRLRRYLVCIFKQQFLIFKQHYMYFDTLFHQHVFSKIFLNNNFQFLNTCTKRTLNFLSYSIYYVTTLHIRCCSSQK